MQIHAYMTVNTSTMQDSSRMDTIIFPSCTWGKYVDNPYC